MTSLILAALFSHAFVDAVDLDGAWEMAYSPYEYPRMVMRRPEFKGEIVEKAIPGYWEDMFSGSQYRIHPLHFERSFPIRGTADDMTLPNIRGCFFYRRQITLDREGAALLRFEGVRNQVHVWINGRFVAFRQGFSTPFELKIPEGVLKKGGNTIELAVSNNPILGYSDQVCGLTTRAVFGSTGGVNGHLELAFPKNDLGDVHVTTAADLKSFTVHVEGKAEYEWEIPGYGSGRAQGGLTLPVKSLALWSPECPVRHQLILRTAAGEFRQRFGLRRLVAEGEKLKLNGKYVYLRGITEHCYFPLTVHLPRDLDYYRMVTKKRKELGFNFVRFHTFVPPKEYLDACDELGYLVHLESPNFTDLPEWESIIALAASHPSVVIYCTGNEYRIDRLAETYLERVAELVHTRTDALFSPVSALRGLEYVLYPGKDVISKTPFPHNPERFARVARYADLYSSYQNSATSYEALNSANTAEKVDTWGDVYRKPRLAHEICIDGTYVDFSTEKLYPADSPILKTGMFSGLRQLLKDRGILGKAELYYRNSCEWQRRCRKFCFEKIRSMKRTMGYDFLGDINTHWHTFGYSVGMMDEFYRLKPTETVENVLRYNSAAVLLNDLGSDFNFAAGSERRVRISISNFDREAVQGRLAVRLVNEKGETVFANSFSGLAAPMGEVSSLATAAVRFPKAAKPARYFLRAEFAADGMKAANEWEVYAFPGAGMPRTEGVKVVDDITKEDLLAAMAKGEKVVLFGAGPFNSLPASFQIVLPGRTSGNVATVVKNHPALGDFPHEGFCGWQFRRLMQGARAVQLEAGVPFDPIVDVASSVKNPIRQSFLCEYRIGEGRLLVCSFRFDAGEPAADYLKAKVLAYAASDAFRPPLSLTPEQLAAVIDAEPVSLVADSNRASNVNDPANEVRSDEHAQP